MDDRFDDIQALLALVAEEHGVPGLAVAAMVDGELACVATHGWRDVERQLPMTADTPARWYSISKPITTLALAQLVDAGRVRWDQAVSEFVPGLRFADPVATARATVTDCLLHQTGLPAGNWTWWQAPADPAELLRRLAHIPCSAGFREGHHYQNLGFTILGEVFRACGTTWAAAVREVLTPFGIRPLTGLAEFVAADRMVGYGPNGFMPATRAVDFDFAGVAPASAVCGTIVELARLGHALVENHRVWAELLRPRIPLSAPTWPEMTDAAVALAGRTMRYRGEPALVWSGGWVGYGSHLVVVPSRRVAVAVLANRTASNAPDLLAWSLLDRAAGWGRAPWAERYLEQKRAMRKGAADRLARRAARPRGVWPATLPALAGRFAHAGYGELATVVDGGELRLRFRGGEWPLTPRADGVVSAEGGTGDYADDCWNLRPVLAGADVVAWEFGPDDSSAPCRFARCDS